jgi:hypothetical protein
MIQKALKTVFPKRIARLIVRIIQQWVILTLILTRQTPPPWTTPWKKSAKSYSMGST